MAYTPQSFAVAVLKRLGAPVTPANVRALTGWEKAEGGHWHNQARFNPLNTTQPAPGAGNTGSQGNIKVYRSPQQGVNATVRTLKNGRYAGILAAFANGHNPNAVAQAIGNSPWGTSGGLVAQTIGATPAPGHIPAGNVGGSSGGSTTRTTRTTSITPEAQSAQRSALAQFVMSNHPDPLSLAQNYAALGQQTQTTTKVRTTPDAQASSGGSQAAPKAAGVVKFDGKPVAAWIAPALAYARQHGWKGTVNSGYRTDAEQKRIYDSGVRPAAKPKAYGGSGSNHEGSRFPLGAVDVSDAQTLSRILQGSKYAHLLVWAGGKDPVHFSHPHGGSY